MAKQTDGSHIDTDELVLDDALGAAMSALATPPDANGHMTHGDGLGRAKQKFVRATLRDGRSLDVSVLRVAVAFSGRRLTRDQEAGHVCGLTGTGGKPLCIAPDHLEPKDIDEQKRRLARARHIGRLRRSGAIA